MPCQLGLLHILTGDLHRQRRRKRRTFFRVFRYSTRWDVFEWSGGGSSIPDHDDGDDPDAGEDRQELEEGRVDAARVLRLEALGDEMVDGHVEEDPAGEAHGDAEDPVGHASLRGGVDGDADPHADGARHGERQGVGHGRDQRPLRQHPQEGDPHGDGGEYLVQADRPQVPPRVSGGV